MTTEKRTNAIENVKIYLGKIGAVLAALILITSFIVWYGLQIQYSAKAIESIFSSFTNWSSELSIRMGAALGVLIALLSIKGIKTVKWVCVISLPLLIVYALYVSLYYGSLNIFSGTWSFSLSAIIISMAILLPGIVNLPTFFRHSRSKKDAILALSLMTIFITLFQYFSIFTGLSLASDFLLLFKFQGGFSFPLVSTIIFIILSLICANLANIYFASAGWEAIIPKVAGAKEYVITGLMGTLIFTFFQISPPIVYFEVMMTNLIANLGVVLFIDFLVRMIVKHRPRTYEKIISFFCWAIGSLASIIAQAKFPEKAATSMITGICATTFAFLLVLFLEEAIWSIKTLSKENQ